MTKGRRKRKFGLVGDDGLIDINEGLGKHCNDDKEISLKSHYRSLKRSKRATEDIGENISCHMDYIDTEEVENEGFEELEKHFEQFMEIPKELVKRIPKSDDASPGNLEKLNRVCVENIENPAFKEQDEKSEVSQGKGSSSTTPPGKKEEKDQQEDNETKDEKKGISAYSLAKLLVTLFRFIVIDKIAYFYEKTFGYYIPLIADYSEIIIRQCIPDEYSHKVTSFMVGEIIWWIKADKSLRVENKISLIRSSYINFENGVLEVASGRFTKHMPKLCFTNYVNASYPNSKKIACTGNLFKSFIEHFTNGDIEMEMLIQEIGGYIISENRTLKKAFFFIGVSHSGKSTLIDLFTKIVGEEFCSSIGFHDLNDKFRLIAIVGKKFNGAAEIGEINTERFDIFKKLTGNDVVMAEDKGKTPIQFRNTAAMAFAGNEFPSSKKTDITNAFFNRVIVVPCTAGIEEKDHDRNLIDKIWENERSYVVKWCVEGLQRLISNNMVFTDCSASQKVKMEFVYEQNSYKAFIDNACELNPQYETFTKDLKAAYTQFCLKNEMVKLDDAIWQKYLKIVLGLKRMRSRDENQHNSRGYIGIKIKDGFLA
jgi:putative DNA primase/helicase